MKQNGTIVSTHPDPDGIQSCVKANSEFDVRVRFGLIEICRSDRSSESCLIDCFYKNALLVIICNKKVSLIIK